MAVKKITLTQLLAGDNDVIWSYLGSSETWSYYVNYKDGDWTKKVRIKKSFVNRYLDGDLKIKPPNIAHN